MRSLSTPTCRSTLAKRSRSFIVISCPNPPRPPASPAVHPGLFIFQPLQDQFAMPLESTKSLLKDTQHRHGNVDVMAAVFQLFNQPFLFGDVLLASRDMAIGLGQMLAFTVRIDHGHLFPRWRRLRWPRSYDHGLRFLARSSACFARRS